NLVQSTRLDRRRVQIESLGPVPGPRIAMSHSTPHHEPIFFQKRGFIRPTRFQMLSDYPTPSKFTR
ncbi:MAG: hypothetical protein VX936_12445, partial [Planctomycetota bacterium]|nr:hypothetical protein [Planctomycetota bacterium]